MICLVRDVTGFSSLAFLAASRKGSKSTGSEGLSLSPKPLNNRVQPIA
jgi:hypothetical protein